MSFMSHLEKIYALENANFFKDFDTSQLKFACDLYLKETEEDFGSLQIPESKKAYDEMIDKVLEKVTSIFIDKKAISDFLSNKNNFNNLNLLSPNLYQINSLQINIRYFDEFIMEIKETIDDILAGDDVSPSNISMITASNIPFNIEKQVIRGIPNDFYGLNSKNLIRNRNEEPVKVDNVFIKEKVLPFLGSYDTIKQITINEATLIRKSIHDAIMNIDLLYKSLFNYANRENISKETMSKVSSIAYNACRNAYEIISFLTFVVIRKMVNLIDNTLICNQLYNDIMNVYSTESAVISSVLPLDPDHLADELVLGNFDTFTDVTKKMVEFYTEIPSMNFYGQIMNEVLDNKDPFEKTEYTSTESDKLYSDINASLMSIKDGIKILLNNKDDQFLVLDEVKQQAGFGVPLLDRFKSIIEEINDVSYYKNSLSGYSFGNKEDLKPIENMIGEIIRFNNRMYYISRKMKDTFVNLKEMKDVINKNISDEFKHTEFIMDFLSFVDLLTEEYIEYIKEIAKSLMNRLFNINEILSSIESNGKTFASIGIPEEDYTESVFDSMIENVNDECILECAEIEKDFYSDFVMMERGEKVVYEADQPVQQQTGTQPTVQQQTQTNTTQQNNTQNQNNGTKVTIQDGDNTGGGKSTVSKIGEWVKNTINKFLDFIKKQEKKNMEWLNSNKEGLINRSYNNVTVNILPYNNIQPATITQDIKKLTNSVKSLNAQVLNSLNDKNALYKKMFSFISGGISDGDVSLKDQFTKYYKVGRAELQVTPISNGELKTEISNTMIPYCESFYSTFSNEVDTNLEALSQAVDGMQDGYAQANVGDKGKWISEAVKMYSGSILNAIRDRNYDYFKVLSSLAPAAPVKPTENKSNTKNQNNNAAEQNNDAT